MNIFHWQRFQPDWPENILFSWADQNASFVNALHCGPRGSGKCGSGKADEHTQIAYSDTAEKPQSAPKNQDSIRFLL